MGKDLLMPANKNARLRYAVIDRMLAEQPSKYYTLAQIAEQCGRRVGRAVSTHCIEKDFRKLISGEEEPVLPRAPIEYSRANRGYYYAEQGFSLFQVNLTEAEWDSLRYAALLFFQHRDVPVFAHFKSAIERLSKALDLGIEPDESFEKRYVQFENPVSNSGLCWIPHLYRAITKQGSAYFEYENIYKRTYKSYQLTPYLLKEHRNRWYVIGWVEERGNYLTFALDRILALRVDELRQPLRDDFNVDLFLQHSIGITQQADKPDKIRLFIKPPLDRLLELEPLHHSQKLIHKKADGMEIQLSAYLNQELEHRLLGFGPYCQVKSPQKLVRSVRDLAQQTLRQYPAIKRS